MQRETTNYGERDRAKKNDKLRERERERERESAQSKMTNNTGFNVTIQKFYNYVF